MGVGVGVGAGVGVGVGVRVGGGAMPSRWVRVDRLAGVLGGREMRRQSQRGRRRRERERREAQKDPTRALGSLDQALAEYESSSSEPNREIHCSGRLLLLPLSQHEIHPIYYS